MEVLENTPAVLSLGKLCEENGYSSEWINGQKPHLIKNGIRIQCNTENFVPIVVPGLSASSSSGSDQSTSRTLSREESHCSSSSSSSSSSPTTATSSDSETREREVKVKLIPLQCLCQVQIDRGNPLFAVKPFTSKPKPTKKSPKQRKKETMIERENPLFADSGRASSDTPEWLQEFRENLVDDRVPEYGDSHARSSREVSLEPTFKRREDLCKHSVYTNFPKDRNCEICLRTKITRAPCRRRIGGAVPRAENFGDLITADHKVLSEGCESRNNHRFAIVVQDLATQWIQAYPCKLKLHRKLKEACNSSWSPTGSLKSFTRTIPWEFGKACKDLSWNHCTSTPHRSETNGIAEKAVRRVKDGTSAVLLQSGLDANWWADSMESCCHLRNVTDLLSVGKTPYERRFGKPKKGPIIPFGSLVEYYPISAKDQSRFHQFGKKVLPGLLLGYALCTRVEFGKVTHWLQTLRS